MRDLARQDGCPVKGEIGIAEQVARPPAAASGQGDSIVLGYPGGGEEPFRRIDDRAGKGVLDQDAGRADSPLEGSDAVIVRRCRTVEAERRTHIGSVRTTGIGNRRISNRHRYRRGCGCGLQCCILHRQGDGIAARRRIGMDRLRPFAGGAVTEVPRVGEDAGIVGGRRAVEDNRRVRLGDIGSAGIGSRCAGRHHRCRRCGGMGLVGMVSNLEGYRIGAGNGICMGSGPGRHHWRAVAEIPLVFPDPHIIRRSRSIHIDRPVLIDDLVFVHIVWSAGICHRQRIATGGNNAFRRTGLAGPVGNGQGDVEGAGSGISMGWFLNRTKGAAVTEVPRVGLDAAIVDGGGTIQGDRPGILTGNRFIEQVRSAGIRHRRGPLAGGYRSGGHGGLPGLVGDLEGCRIASLGIEMGRVRSGSQRRDH